MSIFDLFKPPPPPPPKPPPQISGYLVVPQNPASGVEVVILSPGIAAVDTISDHTVRVRFTTMRPDLFTVFHLLGRVDTARAHVHAVTTDTEIQFVAIDPVGGAPVPFPRSVAISFTTVSKS